MGWEDGCEFELGEEVEMIRDAARDFAQNEVLPLAEKIDKEHWYPAELIPKMGALGFMGAVVPEQYSGSGLSQVAYCLIVEELAAACASTSIIVSAHNSLGVSPVVNFGSEEQKQRVLPDLATGKGLACFALSEPGSGSDAAALTCTYKKVGDKFIVNGAKNWLTNGPKATSCILFATNDTSAGYKGVSAFVHPMDLPGLELGKPEDKLGICGSPTCGTTYQDVELGPEHLLGNEGDGFKIGMSTLNGGRLGVAAQAIGIARAALRDSLAYAKERKTFGKPIGKHQLIQGYFADMIMKIDAARYLTLGAALKKDRGEKYIRQASMAKLFASEAATFAAHKGVQIHGGYGYVKDFPAERHLRDARITEIYEGTSEIQRIVIGSKLFEE